MIKLTWENLDELLPFPTESQDLIEQSDNYDSRYDAIELLKNADSFGCPMESYIFALGKNVIAFPKHRKHEWQF